MGRTVDVHLAVEGAVLLGAGRAVGVEDVDSSSAAAGTAIPAIIPTAIAALNSFAAFLFALLIISLLKILFDYI